ncbi:MAG: prolipoprotein diacylglyceryl transferase [Deltaproteobacteria bacterium]|nr:prolipoprotein diacylglyceryl transferase [Deltaproteobacteria bacterium]
MQKLELQKYLFWAPDNYINIYKGYGVEVYNLLSWISVAAGILYLFLWLKKKDIPLKKILISLLIVTVAGVVFTRLFHIVFWDFNEYLLHPSRFFQIRAGRSVHGTLFGFMIGALILWKYLKIPFSEIADRLSLWLIFGLMLARIGNFYNSEMIGSPSALPWAVRFYFSADRGGTPRHPVQLYESFFAFVILVSVIGVLIKTKNRKPLLITGIVLTGFFISRFIFDFIKHAPGHLAGDFLTTGQMLSIPFFIIGLYILLMIFVNRQRSRV